jgi:catechol 2,3-dioxygenase-like lactoylglutathione lyase family enzyme
MMELGVFSVSLAVKDLQVSKAFYEKLGFTVFGGNGKNWQILKNGTTIIGLFQGMFEKHPHLQSGLEQRRPVGGRLHGRARAAATAEGARSDADDRGR